MMFDVIHLFIFYLTLCRQREGDIRVFVLHWLWFPNPNRIIVSRPIKIGRQGFFTTFFEDCILEGQAEFLLVNVAGMLGRCMPWGDNEWRYHPSRQPRYMAVTSSLRHLSRLCSGLFRCFDEV
jgi:hypothetical protein